MESNEEFEYWLLELINFWNIKNKKNLDNEFHTTTMNVLDELSKVMFAYKKFNGNDVGYPGEFDQD